MSDWVVLWCTVCVFVNRGCDCGPILNPRLISQLPSQFGPGSIRRVLRAAVQACVDCSPDQSTIYNLLREGTGRVVITGECRRRRRRCKSIRVVVERCRGGAGGVVMN